MHARNPTAAGNMQTIIPSSNEISRVYWETIPSERRKGWSDWEKCSWSSGGVLVKRPIEERHLRNTAVKGIIFVGVSTIIEPWHKGSGSTRYLCRHLGHDGVMRSPAE